MPTKVRKDGSLVQVSVIIKADTYKRISCLAHRMNTNFTEAARYVLAKGLKHAND